jgi:hypothetical protein
MLCSSSHPIYRWISLDICGSQVCSPAFKAHCCPDCCLFGKLVQHVVLRFWKNGIIGRTTHLFGYEDVSDLCFNFAVATVAPPTGMTQRSSHLAQKQLNKSKKLMFSGSNRCGRDLCQKWYVFAVMTICLTSFRCFSTRHASEMYQPSCNLSQFLSSSPYHP